jgi:lipopolysaccharide biosynthesis regulator YciM
MGHPYHHALSSVKKWGGTADDYLPLHQWFDESKAISADFRHRALRHHAENIFDAGYMDRQVRLDALTEVVVPVVHGKAPPSA